VKHTTIDVEHAIAGLRPRAFPRLPATRKAAVAAVFHDQADGAALLFIRRATDSRDPWSGQMGLPGGRVDAADSGPLAAAIRETREELALELDARGRLLGRLSEVRTHLPPRSVPRSVVPFAFAVAQEPELRPNQEVEEALWVPLAFLADRRNRERFTWHHRSVPLLLPCYRFEGRLIWGLTLRILDELLAAL
jgi:8-oxo-dGTP pyrophosphatase MutT (NUDIX family)